MAGMERFTQRAKRVLSLAHLEAERPRNNNIGTEHLLIGLMEEAGGVASRALREFGLETNRVREIIARVTSPSTDFDLNRIKVAPDTQEVLDYSVDEARRLGHHYIGTEHILLGLVRVDGAGREVLRRLGVTPEQIRRQTRRVLNEPATAEQSANPTPSENPVTAEALGNLEELLDPPKATGLESEKGSFVKLTTVDGMAISDLYSQEDLLGYKDYMEALANFIESPKTKKPLTIGIDAAWGGGKTTLMRMLEKRLSGTKQNWWGRVKSYMIIFWRTGSLRQDTSHFKTVWFDAWLYDKEEALWAAMALEIWSQAAQRVSFLARAILALSLNFKRIEWNNLISNILKALLLSFALAALGYLGFIGISIWLGKNTIQTIDWLRHYVKVFAGLGLVSILYTIFKDIAGIINSPFRSGISLYLRSPDYAAKIGFIREFQHDYRFIVESITQKGKWPLVVFIDDLDRCTPDKAAEVIEAINLLLDTEYSIFVIGMDTGMLSRSIQAKYKDLQPFFDEVGHSGHTNIGRHFLEKIVQIDFHIPRPDITHMQDFIRAQLGKQILKLEDSPEKQIAVSLMQAEQRTGKSRDEAREAVEQARPDLEAVIQEASETVQESTFEDMAEVENAINEMALYLEYNPRRIKRFINIYRLQALIAHQRGLLGYSISFSNLAH